MSAEIEIKSHLLHSYLEYVLCLCSIISLENICKVFFEDNEDNGIFDLHFTFIVVSC